MRSFSLVCLTVSAILLAPRGTGQVERKSRPPEVKPAPIERRALANRDAIYVSLRKVGVGQEQIAVKNFTLKREAGVFVFRSGTFQLLEPVRGKITGAVFLGDASFTVTPPIAVERRNLAILSRGKPFECEDTVPRHVSLVGVKQKPKKAMIGYLDDVFGQSGEQIERSFGFEAHSVDN